MGMDYYIKANIKNNCENDFPEGLSNFFEQFPVSDFNSEVRQVSQILDINLDAFQAYDHGTDDLKEEQCWQDIEAFASLVDSFINKIEQNRDYYRKVRYNKDGASVNGQLHELFSKNDVNAMADMLHSLHQNSDIYFPEDRGYLSENRIVKDLYELKETLSCYKKAGATEILLSYG
jgi:hypothetical protein